MAGQDHTGASAILAAMVLERWPGSRGLLLERM